MNNSTHYNKLIVITRCFRLKKQCIPSESIRKRTSKDSAARTAHLEQKLDGLVSLLQSVAQSAGSTAPLSTALNDAFAATQVSQGTNTILTPISSNSKGTVLHAVTPGSAITPNASVSDDFRVESQATSFNNTLGLSDEEAEERLIIFRDQMMKYFPFFSLLPDVSAQQLYSNRPFLFRCIAAVATPSTQQRIVASRNIKKELARRLVIENEASIDLLLGLLVFSSW